MIRNILAVVAGFIVGSIANMTLINVGHAVVGLPPGADVSTMEGVKAAMAQFTPIHFTVPFIAHAGGTLVGAFVAALISRTHKFVVAMIVGVLFLLGGVTAGIMISSPMWYNVIDFLFAYIPMAWLGAKLGGARKA
jgi:hypothetical protein